MNKLGYIQGYMDKESAPRWVKMFQQGKLSPFQVAKLSKRLGLNARTLQMINPYSFEKSRGLEGMAHLTSHPKAGLAVMKTYDPTGLFYNPEYLMSKVRAHKRLPADIAARFLNVHKTRPAVYSEYIMPNMPAGQIGNLRQFMAPSSGATSAAASTATNYQRVADSLKRSGLKYTISDLKGDNMINNKIVDFILLNKKFYKTKVGEYIKVMKELEKGMNKGLISRRKGNALIDRLGDELNAIKFGRRGLDVVEGPKKFMARVPNDFRWYGV